MGDRIFFVANETDSGFEFWGSDGMSAGTTLVKSFQSNDFECSRRSWRLVPFLYLNGFDADHRSDRGSRTGRPTERSSSTTSCPERRPRTHKTLSGWVRRCFSRPMTRATGGGSGLRAGTGHDSARQRHRPWNRWVKSQPAGCARSACSSCARRSARHRNLATDGTVAGTVLVKDIRPGPDSPMVGFFGAFGAPSISSWQDAISSSGRRRDNRNGAVDVRWDGSGTSLLRNINVRGADLSPQDIVALGSSVLFHASVNDKGDELWRSDGTTSGTSLVKDIRPGPLEGSIATRSRSDDSLLRRVRRDENRLWKSDGTSAGTSVVKDIFPIHLEPAELTLLFIAATTQATDSGSRMARPQDGPLKRFVADEFADPPDDLTAVGDTVYFTADDEAARPVPNCGGRTARLREQSSSRTSSRGRTVPAPRNSHR